MADTTASKTVTVTVDGRTVTCEYRTPLIEVAARLGITIPTLCHHRDLEPAGACRVCVVEEVRDGWSKFVTACNYPVADGMVFRTTSDEVLRYRRMTLEALLGRCPEVPAIVQLAARNGVTASRFPRADETCILCGLCTRVCQTFATSAISTIGRGNKKVVGTFGNQPPEDCIGCGACEQICPTGHIQSTRTQGVYSIWEKSFELPVCKTDASLCRSCGACEEACPFAVPRVVMRADGHSTAVIRPDACRGCGVCLAACPSGSITQPAAPRDIPAQGTGLLVFACTRSNLGGIGTPKIPEGAHIITMPCVGGVSLPSVLGALARGFDGVLVLGRHESTCRLDGSESHAIDIVDQANDLAMLVGLGPDRVTFAEPAPGPEGPVAAIVEALAHTTKTPLGDRLPADHPIDNHDDAMEVVKWLSRRPELAINGGDWLERKGLPSAKPGMAVLHAGAIPYLETLKSPWLTPYDLSTVLMDALSVLKHLGIEVGVAMAQMGAGESDLAAAYPDSDIFCLCQASATRLRESGARATWLNDLLAETPQLLAGVQDNTVAAEPIEVGPTGHVTPEIRNAMARQLARADAAGATTLVVNSPAQLVQYLFETRTGSWRRTHARPMLPVTLAATAATGSEVTK